MCVCVCLWRSGTVLINLKRFVRIDLSGAYFEEIPREEMGDIVFYL